MWAEGQIVERVSYYAWVGNSLNTLNGSTVKIDRNLVYAANAWWELGDWGPPGPPTWPTAIWKIISPRLFAWGHRLPAPGRIVSRILTRANPKTQRTFDSDGVLFCETGSLAPA